MTRTEAETAIGKILKELETTTGALVEKVELVNIDVTDMGSAGPEWASHVSIILRPIPGRRW